ncbi:MAG: sensor histidine kinase [Polyangiaceae bacterium]|nr:sensor histidine kinase [Polyangiaceae bacterium]
MKSCEAHDGSCTEVAETESDLAGALHEVSNVLTIVLGWLDKAQTHLPPGEARSAVEVARSHAWLGHRIARRAIGAEVPDDLPRPAREIADQVVRGIQWEASRHGVRVVSQTDTGRTLVDAPGAAQQVLLNLLLNAVAFSPPGAVVELRQWAAHGDVIFSVRDQGPGIDWEAVSQKQGAPISTRRGGAGIGLAHSIALARSRGGELDCATSGAGGTTFELRWPRGHEPSGARVSNPPPRLLEQVRVLVLEDDPAVVSLIEVALEARGADVVSVANLPTLRSHSSRAFDVALVDLSPISSDVLAGLREIRERWRGVAIVLITGTAVALPSGADEHLAAWVRKPFDMNEIVDVLGEVVGR